MPHVGKCFCGAVELEVTGSPEAMGYCHCSSCRSWSGGPVNAFSLWKPENVRITAGADHVGTFQKTELSQRQYCTRCGGHLMTNHPPLGLSMCSPRRSRRLPPRRCDLCLSGLAPRPISPGWAV